MKKLLCILLSAILLLSLAMPIFAGSGASSSDTLDLAITGNTPVTLSIPKGKTLWYTYTNTDLVANGEYTQKLILNCAEGFTGAVTYIDGGVEKTVDADADGFINVVLTDKNKTGAYTFAITNKSDVARPGRYTVSFESLPKYVLTGLDIFLGDNNITYDNSAPTALYSFSSGDVIFTGEDGNVISTKKGPGPGKYKFTVLNTAGKEIKEAQLGNWGTIGYPYDMTGDVKTNTFTWNTAETDASFLLGVSNVFENFVIRVERTGDYVSEQPEIVFEDYVNVHTPGSFELPAGDIVEFDIKKTYTLVADESGVYHLNTVDGAVVYVDMINNVMDLYGAFHNAYGATALRGIYTNDLGVTCGYEFYGAMEAYANALDTEGNYPMTVDLEKFIKYFGAAQGWFTEGYTPYPEIENGGNLESYWLVEAFYIVPGSGSNDTSTNTPETDTNDPETNAPESNNPETSTPVTDAPAVNEPGTSTPGTDAPVAGTPDANDPEKDTTVVGAPESSTPDANDPEKDTTVVGAPESSTPDAPVAGTPDADETGKDTTVVGAPETNAPDAPVAGNPETNKPENDTPVAGDSETNAPETEVEVEDVVVDPIVSDDSGDIKLPITLNVDVKTSTKLAYTFEFNTKMFEFKEITGLDKEDYTVEITENGVVITITNMSKVAAAKAGSQIFELVISPKTENAKSEDLNLKVEVKNEKQTSSDAINGIGTAPNKAPATGDNMIFVVVAVLAIAVVFVVIRRRRDSL